MYGPCCLAYFVGFTLWHGLRVSLGALVSVPDRRGGLYDRELRSWGRHLISAARLPVTVAGLERLEPRRPYVFASNHASFVDTWVLTSYLPGSLRFIAKRGAVCDPAF